MSDLHEFESHHIEAALALWNATDNIGLSSADEPEALVSFLRRNPGMSYVAFDGERLVGTVLCGHDGRRGYIHHLAVAADRRRERLGSRLLERALKALAEEGIGKCHAFVFGESPYGELFWSRQGWQRRGDIAVYSRNIDPG